MAKEASGANSGFVLPNPNESSNLPAGSSEQVSLPPLGSMTVETPAGQIVLTQSEDTSVRDGMFLLAGILVLGILFFIIKNQFAHHLVAKRIPPVRANQAAWWLFVFLMSLGFAVVFMAINFTSFFSVGILIPTGVVAIVSLILCLISARK